jgi:cyclohexanecarboxylate-CoA ligase
MHDYLNESVAAFPDKVAFIGYRTDRPDPEQLTYTQLNENVDYISRALLDLGIQRHDVVSVQLPNWWQALAMTLACTRIGAVTNPLMPIFRDRELTYMLGLCEAKLIVIPKTFRDFDYPEMLTRIRSNLPNLEHVVVVDGEGEDGFDALFERGRALANAGASYTPEPLAPQDVQCVKFTSGTTGNPKGVMHTSNTLMAAMECLRERLDIGSETVALTGSPVGHMSGYLMLSLFPVRLGGTMVYVDVWEPKRAMELAVKENITYTVGSTPFLADMIQLVEQGYAPPPKLSRFLCAGAPIPPVQIEKARDLMNLGVTSSYGATEIPGATLTEPARATEKSAVSDGRAARGWEIRIVDDEGAPVSSGVRGRIQARGPGLFAGYLKHPELNDTDENGWFDTGDLGSMDDEGYVRVAGRNKDIIIRGGENIPVAEVENELMRHPAIATVAVVGFPDERLGERAAAFVATKPGQTFTHEDMTSHLEAAHMARQYWPEKLEVLNSLPTTPTGKVQKYKLKELAENFSV